MLRRITYWMMGGWDRLVPVALLIALFISLFIVFSSHGWAADAPCLTHACSNDTRGVLDDQGISWSWPESGVEWIEIWRGGVDGQYALCDTLRPPVTTWSLVGSPCYSRPSPIRVYAVGCRKENGTDRCQIVSESPSVEFLFFACIEGSCEKPCFSGAPDALLYLVECPPTPTP